MVKSDAWLAHLHTASGCFCKVCTANTLCLEQLTVLARLNGEGFMTTGLGRACGGSRII